MIYNGLHHNMNRIDDKTDIINYILECDITSQIKSPTSEFQQMIKKNILFLIHYLFDPGTKKSNELIKKCILLFSSQSIEVEENLYLDKEAMKLLVDFPKRAKFVNAFLRGLYCKVLECLILVPKFDFFDIIENPKAYLNNILGCTKLLDFYDFMLNLFSSQNLTRFKFFEKEELTKLLLDRLFSNDGLEERYISLISCISKSVVMTSPIVSPLFIPEILQKLIDFALSSKSNLASKYAFELILSIYISHHGPDKEANQIIKNNTSKIVGYLVNGDDFNLGKQAAVSLLSAIIQSIFSPEDSSSDYEIEDYNEEKTQKIENSTVDSPLITQINKEKKHNDVIIENSKISEPTEKIPKKKNDETIKNNYKEEYNFSKNNIEKNLCDSINSKEVPSYHSNDIVSFKSDFSTNDTQSHSHSYDIYSSDTVSKNHDDPMNAVLENNHSNLFSDNLDSRIVSSDSSDDNNDEEYNSQDFQIYEKYPKLHYLTPNGFAKRRSYSFQTKKTELPILQNSSLSLLESHQYSYNCSQDFENHFMGFHNSCPENKFIENYCFSIEEVIDESESLMVCNANDKYSSETSEEEEWKETQYVETCTFIDSAVYLINLFFKKQQLSFLHNSVLEYIHVIYQYTDFFYDVVEKSKLVEKVLDIIKNRNETNASFWGHIHRLSSLIDNYDSKMPNELKERWCEYFKTEHEEISNIIKKPFGGELPKSKPNLFVLNPDI